MMPSDGGFLLCDVQVALVEKSPGCNMFALLSQVESQLLELASSYPDIAQWYSNKVVPELYASPPTRNIFLAMPKDEPDKLAAFCIVKRSVEEKKVCTIFVLDRFQGKGLGSVLFERAFLFLQTRLPSFSISQRLITDFSGLIEKFGFVQGPTMQDCYVKGDAEIFFNHALAD